MSLGAPELIVIVILVLLLFGPDKLPDLARGLGKGIREVRKITGEFQNHLNLAGDDDDEPRRNTNSAATVPVPDTTRHDVAPVAQTPQHATPEPNTTTVLAPPSTVAHSSNVSPTDVSTYNAPLPETKMPESPALEDLAASSRDDARHSARQGNVVTSSPEVRLPSERES